MRKPMSLRLRVTLLCAALLTLCCLLLTVTNNFSAIRMADAIQAVPLLPAQRAELEDSVSLPMAELHISDTIQQAQGAFHMQSLLSMVAILALGLFLIYRLVGKALAPLDTLTCQIRERTAADLAQPVEIPDSGDEAAALALAFNQMSQRLNQVFVMQRNFSRNAAHEFRTPLAVLKTRIGLFRKKQDFRPQATLELLQIVEGEVDRLSAMVSELLELTNLERASRGERLSSGQLIRSAADQAAPRRKRGASPFWWMPRPVPWPEMQSCSGRRYAIWWKMPSSTARPAALYTSRATGMGNGSKSWLPTRDPASRNRSASGFSSPFSGWMIPAPDSWAVPDLDWHWCGPSRSSTAALFMWKNPGEREADSS